MRSLSPHTNRSSFISQPFVHSNKICQPFGRIGLFEECNLCKNIENLRRFMQFYLISSQRNKNCEFSSFHVTIAIISSSSSNPFITSQVAIESMRRKMLNWLRAMNKFVIFHSKKKEFSLLHFSISISSWIFLIFLSFYLANGGHLGYGKCIYEGKWYWKIALSRFLSVATFSVAI